MTPAPRAFVGPALIGFASGLRSMTGLGVLVASTPRATRNPDATLHRTWVKAVGIGLAVQEDVMDKLPNTPSRLEPLGLGARMATAAAGAVLGGYRSRARSRTPIGRIVAVVAPHTDRSSDAAARTTAAASVAVAVAASAAGAWLGYHARVRASARLGSDLPGALVEDLTAAGLGYLAASEFAR